MGVNAEPNSYWTRMMRRRYSRRSVVRGALLGGAGMAAAAALACKGTTTSSSSTGSPAKSASGGTTVSALAGLDSRSGAEPKGPPIKGGTLNWYLTGNPPSLDPTQNVSANTSGLAGAVYSRLFSYKWYFDVVQSLNLDTAPDLAQTAESPDAVTWTVKLRPNAKFQNIAPVNGHAVEAEDIKQSFLKATAPQSVNAGNLGFIDPTQIQTPDKQTVVFKLNYPYAVFVASGLASRYSWIFPREAANGGFDPAKKMIGSGPWILDSVTPDVAITYKKNPDFYDAQKPYVDAVREAILPDPNARISQFASGHVDQLSNVLLNDVPTVQQENPKAESIHLINNANGIMYYNLGDPKSPFQDIRLRQALAMSVDREAYAKASGYQSGQYIQTFMVSPGIGKWAAVAEDYPSDTIQWYKYDPQRARQMMDAAGGSKLNVRMIYPTGNPVDQQLGGQAQTVFSMVKQLPWNVSYVTVDYNREWIAGGKGIGYPGGGVPADGMAWWGPGGVGPTVDEYVYNFYHSKGAGNLMHLNDLQVDSLIAKARATLKEDERVKAYKDVQFYIASKVYVLMGLVNGEVYTFISPRAQNYQLGDIAAGLSNWAQMWLTA
jgi:peptide/nickel transport system substrate-binding protein